MPTVVVNLSMNKVVCEISNTKKFSKPMGGVLNRGASYHASTAGIKWAPVRVEYDENSLSRNSYFQAGDGFRMAIDNGNC